MQEISWSDLAAAFPSGGLFAEKSWRWSPKPLGLSGREIEELEKLGHRLWLFQKACNDLYALSAEGRQPAWVAALLDRGKPPELVELSRERRFRNEVPLVLRPDLILTDSGWVMSELDSVPGGIGLTDWFNQTYAGFGFPVVGGAAGMRDGFAAIAPGADILVSKEAQTYRPEMEWLAANNGQRVLDAEGYGARPELNPVVYRFFELFDLPNLPDIESLQAACLEGRVRMTPPWKPQLEEKLWMALFWMRPLRDFWRRSLSERHFQALQRVIPRTWVVDPTPLPPQAEIPDLGVQSFLEVANFSQRDRELVLKASGFSERAWGARSVVIGSDEPQAVWRGALQNALEAFSEHPHVLQRFHKARVVSHMVFGQESPHPVEPFPAKVRLCPYYFAVEDRVRLGGVLATLCPPDKKILHGMRDAVLAPVCEVNG